MEHDRLAEEVPRNSREKIAAALEGAMASAPTDEKSARLKQALSVMLPLVSRLGVFPEDPAEIDDLLLKGAGLALVMRSDGAEMPATIEELVERFRPAVDAEAIEEPA